MKKIFFLVPSLFTTMIVFLAFSSWAQDATKATAGVKEISSADKTVIIEIFNNIAQNPITKSPYPYYLEFNGGGEHYGVLTFDFNPAVLVSFREGTNPYKDPNMISKTFFQAYPSMKLLFIIIGVGAKSKDLEYFFGKAAAQRLKAIVTKYSVGQNN